jgi:hypothetical protein
MIVDSLWRNLDAILNDNPITQNDKEEKCRNKQQHP